MATMINGQLILEEEYDENYQPTEHEIFEYAQSIGIDPYEEKDLLFIAQEGIVAPLPFNWKRCQDTTAVTRNVYYYNFQTGESTFKNPRDEYYRSMILEERRRRSAMGASSSKKDKRKKKKKGGGKKNKTLDEWLKQKVAFSTAYVESTLRGSQNLTHVYLQFKYMELYPSTTIGTAEETAVQGDLVNSAKVLNVTLLASEWGSSMGGLSTINRKLAISLAKHTQVNVTLLVPQFVCGEEDMRTANSHDITIREAQRRPGYDPLDWLSFPPKNLAIDIILGHGTKLGKQAQIITETHNCHWVQVVHTAPEELGMHKNYPRAIAKGEEKNRTEVDLCKLADLVVTVGPKLREAYLSYLRSCKTHQDIIELTPGIFHEFKTIQQATHEGKKFKVLTFGRGDSEDFGLKGYDIAAKVVNELKDSSYCLVLVGAPRGQEDKVAENVLQCGISEDQLIVRGFVQSKERLKELFCEVDLAIMPSRTEGFGLTALEALSAGLPILVSGNSGFAHALRDLPSGNSFVVESKDPKEWAKAIASIRQKGRAQRLQEIQTLQTSYEEKYSWEDQCGALVEKLWGMAHES